MSGRTVTNKKTKASKIGKSAARKKVTAKSDSPRPPIYVETDQALERLAHQASQQTAIAVDTESNPLFAYRERLCLIQISTRQRDYIVDPLAGINLDLLVPVFADPAVTKIFHDAEFDVLMLKRAHAFEIAGIFDTKVAVTSLGYQTIGLAPLLKELYDVTLDKKYQRSDWGNRPLTQGQLDYASRDTHYLLPLAEKLRAELRERGEINCLEVATECRRLEGLIPEAREFNADEFVKIKGTDDLTGKERRVLRELFVMRHQIADQLDRPAFKVLSNEVLVRLAKAQPQSDETLKKQKILSHRVREQRGAQVLATIKRALKLNPLDAVRVQRPHNEINRLNEEQRMTYESLRAWRKKVAVERNTDASLVLLRSTMVELSRLRQKPHDLNGLAAGCFLEPWRVRYYGEGILAAMASPGPSKLARQKKDKRRRRRKDNGDGG